MTTDDAIDPGGFDGIGHVVRTLALYALAEHQAGHASIIDVEVEGRTFRVADDGRGHAVERTIAGLPYLPFVYRHLEYPFAPVHDVAVQLHCIGTSLVNAMCSELTVRVGTSDARWLFQYRGGHLHAQARTDAAHEVTGTAISGVVRPDLQRVEPDTASLRQWLGHLAASSPRLALRVNGRLLDGARPTSPTARSTTR